MANLTQKMIMDVFLQLLKKKNLDKITVREIVDRCDINRNTFYYHYSDIFDLFDALICSSFTDAAPLLGSPETRGECIRSISSFMEKNKSALRNSCNSSAYPLLYDRLSTFFDTLFLSMMRLDQKRFDEINDESIKFGVHFFRCAAIGLMKDWLDSDEPSPLEIFLQLEANIPKLIDAFLLK